MSSNPSSLRMTERLDRALISLIFPIATQERSLVDKQSSSRAIADLGIHGLGFVIVAIEKKLVVVLVGIVETVPASSPR
ncbi:hypothetical protein Tco_0927896 [Tanacetum coccineum]